MVYLTDQEKKVVLFTLAVLGVGAALEFSFKVSPSWPRALSVVGNDAFYPRTNVNTATLGELVAVPHIGPSTAKRIVDARSAGGPFRSAEDLGRAGLGDGAIRRVGKYLSF
jgi:competence protein ComEA